MEENRRADFFFLPVPCALEAQTVINTSCFDWRFPHKREKVQNRRAEPEVSGGGTGKRNVQLNFPW